MMLGKYSFGIGDRFGRQGKALLQAIIKAKEQGVNITPVWNKSQREHTITKTAPACVRTEADEAVKAMKWKDSFYVDADHISLENVDFFIDSSDFFTFDVANFINKSADEKELTGFIDKYKNHVGSLAIPGIDKTFDISAAHLEAIASKFSPAIKQAGKIYRHIEAAKGADNFITEISMDETDQPQTAIELYFILVAIADEGIPIQTIAPKFVGHFNKGVDYVGNVDIFAKSFEENLAVITFATREFSSPENLKLSVHSGSDKFSLYGPINKALKKFDAGLHIKTSGTTWLEELAGLAIADEAGLSIAKQVYAKALSRFDELCGPYTKTLDIDKNTLPSAAIVEQWSGADFASAFRHDKSCEKYNGSFRQLLHVAYKIAAEMGDDFLDALEKHEQIISKNVAENIYERHIMPIFME
ncbi:MAG: hypothetical protein JSV82_08900 [Planctomycetota bacterium]|nr:MAG: hypothetical protein JSV82_08900 [Planctomycetota bacterium]